MPEVLIDELRSFCKQIEMENVRWQKIVSCENLDYQQTWPKEWYNFDPNVIATEWHQLRMFLNSMFLLKLSVKYRNLDHMGSVDTPLPLETQDREVK